jgi:hypothetical protein
MNSDSPSLQIGLIENCYHSLKRGYELWGEGQRQQDGWLLKEAVIWIHHGIELGIKQLLVQNNEYLIFDNIDIAVDKLVQLRKQSQYFEASVLDLFEQKKPAFSVGFEKAVERAAIMLNISELSQPHPLRRNIDELTKYRNKIVHYAVTLEVNEIIILISSIMNDFLDLLEQNIQNDTFIQVYLPEIRQASLSIRERAIILARETELRIEKLILKFNNQKVSGNLFGYEQEIALPRTLETNNSQFRDNSIRTFHFYDIKATMENHEQWIVTVRIPLQNAAMLYRMIQTMQSLKSSNSILDRPIKLWFVNLSDQLSSRGKERIREQCKTHDILVSFKEDIENLETLLNVE